MRRLAVSSRDCRNDLAFAQPDLGLLGSEASFSPGQRRSIASSIAGRRESASGCSCNMREMKSDLVIICTSSAHSTPSGGKATAPCTSVSEASSSTWTSSIARRTTLGGFSSWRTSSSCLRSSRLIASASSSESSPLAASASATPSDMAASLSRILASSRSASATCVSWRSLSLRAALIAPEVESTACCANATALFAPVSFGSRASSLAAAALSRSSAACSRFCCSSTVARISAARAANEASSSFSLGCAIPMAPCSPSSPLGL
mmetsp:Transcript_30951/g.77265  ORF Transcript_30951/g.77265 Transcript_30951/m.77265 type:complete len:264 (-) Transcript_30951:214-1005(-)